MIRSTLLAVALFADLSAAETLLVPEQYPTIQSAIDSSQNGDEISVGAGHEEVYISGNKELKIFGREPFGVVIDPSQGGSCLAWYGSVEFENIIFANASDGVGAAFISGEAAFKNCRFIDCECTGHGGGAFGGQSFSGNVAEISLDGCEFIDCYGSHGGAISNLRERTRKFIIESCTFQNCRGSSEAGAIYGTNGGLEIRNSSFISCSASKGGAISYEDLTEDSIITGCTFDSCEAFGSQGGAIAIDNDGTPLLTISNCTFNNNSTVSQGGAIYLNFGFGTNVRPRIEHCTFESNSSLNLGGAVNCDNAIVFQSVFTNNTTPDFGGGIYACSSIVSECTFRQNSAVDGGGGYGTLSNPSEFLGCTFDSNTATGGSGGGLGGSGSFRDSQFCSNVPTPVASSMTDDGLNLYSCVNSGSCCIGVTCIAADEDDCAEAGGSFAQAECIAVDCGSPEGACCLTTQCALLTLDSCFELGGSFAGPGTNCSDTQCTFACEGDVSENGTVDFTDLLILINNWGNCPA